MFLKVLLLILTTKIGVLIVGLLTMVLMLKGLGVEGRGLLAGLLIYPQLLVSLLEGGMRQTATLYLGKKIESADTVMGSVCIYGALVGIIGVGISIVAIIRTATFDYTLLSILIASLLIPVQLYVAYIKGMFLGLEKYENVNKILFVPKILILFAFVVLDIIGEMTVFSVVLIIFIGNAANLIQSYYYLNRLNIPSSHYSLKKTIKMFRQGIPYAISLFLIVANYKLDILLLSQWGDSADVGSYVISVQFGELIWQLPAALSLMLMIKSAKTADRSQFSENVTLISRLSVTISVFIGVILYFVLPVIINLVLDSDSNNKIQNTYLYLFPGLLAMVIFKIVNSDLAGNGSPIYSVWIMLPAVILNIFLNYILIPKYGGEGAAIASSISYIFTTISIITIHKYKYRQSFLSYLLIRPSDLVFLVDKGKNLISRRIR